jgi:hypothetical protein
MEIQSAYEAITEARYQAVLAEEERRQDLIDEILIDEELFTRLAYAYANAHCELVPDLTFLDYAFMVRSRELQPEWGNAWRDE